MAELALPSFIMQQPASAKRPEMRGKGGTLSGGQVTGDLPCRGARGTLPGGQVIPLSFPLSQRGGVVML